MKYLGTYLNDHLAGATGGVELSKRAASQNDDGEYGAFLQHLAKEIEEDRNTLLEVMERLEIPRNHVKVAFGWAAEKVGRLKPNEHLLSYSPLSRVVELEGLLIGVNGKRSLWTSLRHSMSTDPRLAEFDFDDLVARAERHRDGLEEHKLRAVAEMLAAGAAGD